MRGKAGVISVLREADLHLHLGENATDGADGADPTKLQVGECEPDAGNAPNVTRHTIEPELEQRMRRRYSYPNPNPNPNPSPNPNPNQGATMGHPLYAAGTPLKVRIAFDDGQTHEYKTASWHKLRVVGYQPPD